MLEAILLESLLVSFSYAESLYALLILQLQVCLGCAILHQTENLENELGIFNEAAVATHLLILNFSFAYITFVLNFDELNFNNKTIDLYE